MRARHVLLLLPGLLLLPLLALMGQAGAAQTQPLRIQVLSNRADLISGGDALVAVVIPPKVNPGRVQVTLGDRDITDRFAVRQDGQYVGLVTQLADGANVVRATAPGYRGQTVITNHPNGGP